MSTCILVVDDSPTIRRVVSSILERHGYDAPMAADGKDAFDALSSGEVKADLVLVDFVMPRMNGYQFCRAIRENAELASLPVVLMSAKADRIREQFVQQTGAVDAISKPFDAQALVTVVENALRRVKTNRGSSTRLPDFDSDEVTGVAPSTPEPNEYETRRTHVAQVVAAKLTSIVAEVVTERAELDSTELTAVLAAKLSNEAVVEIIGAVSDIVRDEGGGPILEGDLGVLPIGAVLQLLQSENQTGVLYCTSGAAEVRATFREGLIDLVEAVGAGDEFRLGRFFVEEGIVTSEEIDEFMRLVPREEPDAPHSRVNLVGGGAPQVRPLGTALVAAGKIGEAQLKSALVRQSSELLYEVLRWRKGRFSLRRTPPSELAENARLGLPVASVVMEGFRRVDEWRILERTVGDFDAVLLRDDIAFGSLDVGSLPSKEKTVLAAVDGERSVRAIVSASHMSSFDACRILAQFLEARVLRRRAS